MIERAISREGIAIATLAALAVFALALLSPAIFNDSDTFWQIRAGQWMLAHHAVLYRDPFSLSFAGRPWAPQEWLSEIAMAGAFQAFGWSGVAILTGLAMAAAVALLGLYLARRLNPVPCATVLLLGVGCVMPQLLARPHILALPFLTAWVIGLADAVAARRTPRWFLFPVMALWANLHGSFVFGIALILPFALEAALADQNDRVRTAKNWALFALGALAVTLLIPNGLNGLAFPFQLMHLKSLSGIGEWQSPDFHAFNPVEVAVFAAVFFFVWRGVRLPAVRLVLLLVLLHLCLEHARYSMLLGIVGAVLVADPLAAALMRTETASISRKHGTVALSMLGIVMLACSIVRIAYPIRRTDGPMSPISALAAVPRALASEAVFNNYSFGGLLIFDGIKPLVDSRADLYGDSYLVAYSRAIAGDSAAVDEFFRKYHVVWTILAPGDPLAEALDRRPGWRRIFSNGFAVIQVGPGFASPVRRVAPPGAWNE